MKRFLSSLAVALLAGCGASMSTTTTTLTPSTPDDVFDCSRDYAKDSDFWTHSIDESELRLVVRKVKEGVRLSEPLFRRAFDELTIEIDRGTEDATTLRVIARTFYEYMGRRGPTLQAKPASSQAEASAQALLSRCAADGGPTQP